jgi:hypothetical protein
MWSILLPFGGIKPPHGGKEWHYGQVIFTFPVFSIAKFRVFERPVKTGFRPVYSDFPA